MTTWSVESLEARRKCKALSRYHVSIMNWLYGYKDDIDEFLQLAKTGSFHASTALHIRVEMTCLYHVSYEHQEFCGREGRGIWLIDSMLSWYHESRSSNRNECEMKRYGNEILLWLWPLTIVGSLRHASRSNITYSNMNNNKTKLRLTSFQTLLLSSESWCSRQ